MAPESGAVHETLILACPTISAASPVGASAAARKGYVQHYKQAMMVIICRVRIIKYCSTCRSTMCKCLEYFPLPTYKKCALNILYTEPLEKTPKALALTQLTSHCYIPSDTLCKGLLTLPSFSGDMAYILSWEPPHHCQGVHVGS